MNYIFNNRTDNTEPANITFQAVPRQIRRRIRSLFDQSVLPGK